MQSSYYAEYLPRLEGASPKERSQVISDICRTYGCSKSTAYRELKKLGWSSGRRRRWDAGSTDVPEESLVALAAKLHSGIRKDGRHVTEIPAARWALEQNGYYFGVSNSRLAALLRDRELDLKTIKTPTPHVRMRSLHPNHVHMVDPSLCMVYYMENGQRIIEADEVYKNKPFLAGKENLKVWRYVLTDHYSGSICVRYYQAKGETKENLWDFVVYAWSPKNRSDYIFHGVPQIVVWDKGSANTSGPIKDAFAALRVKHIPHAPGPPRAKGQVEKANHLTELMFECHLRDDPAANVEQLNQWVENWCAQYNANTIEGYDSTLRRAGCSRSDLWSAIPSDRLRELPDEARDILAGKAQSRRVSGDLTVSFPHPRSGKPCAYPVGGLEGVAPGKTVTVQPILMDPGSILRVIWTYQKKDFSAEVEPLVEDQAGFPIDAPIFGESFKSPKKTHVDRNRELIEEYIGDRKRPFAHLNDGRGIKSISAIRREDTPVIYLPRTGTPIRVSDGREEVLLNHIEAALKLKARLGFWNPRLLDVVRGTFPGGVPQGRLDELAGTLKAIGRGDDVTECAR